jgi:hypothetical protein
MRRVFAATVLLLLGCAAQKAERAPVRAPAEERPAVAPPEAQAARPARAAPPVPAPTEANKPAQPSVEYERILGTFAIEPEAYLYLTPAALELHGTHGGGAEHFQDLAERFRALGAKKGEAAAELDRGAALWWAGQADRAYAATMRAEALFAELGDLEGLAHAYEWLGYFFRQSGASDRAAEQLRVASRMFTLLEDRASAERVLGYAAR